MNRTVENQVIFYPFCREIIFDITVIGKYPIC